MVPFMMRTSVYLLAITTTSLSAPTSDKTKTRPYGCRYMPTDAGWPSAKQWSRLSKTFGGQVIATVPLTASCHDATAPEGGLHKNWPKYDENECASLKERWFEPELQ
jgi:hypothetical protein